eukprot:CAMPEP_0114554172 /NCGR_PEP_ID=MMETSP0114-20121206/8068_1 /TAXON_ID=31324 /ORGANISM="Goniomonas sp, Strain m" /LENGTH=274 /DNA_ID=CAMNT_0001739201 /DNA_START=37 /DNA_END=861 /DNA_ORIENTATION=+
MSDLKSYVAGDGPNLQGMNLAESTVVLRCSHSNLRARVPELRLDLHMSILKVKEKLYSHFGTSIGSMKLILKNDEGASVAEMDDDSKMLGYYSPQMGWGIHCIDTDPSSITAAGQLENVSLVKKYEMSDEDYDKLPNTYRKHKQEMLAKDPTWTYQKELARRRGEPIPPPRDEKDDDYMEDLAEDIKVGQRCEVNPGGRRGEVKFVGKVPELHPGFWVGVAFDEPQGKNDGSAKGHRYFECGPGYGGFLRPNCVTTGDFPELDDFNLSDDDGEI